MEKSGESSVSFTIGQLLSSLDHVAHGTEDDFLALGLRLQAIHSESSALHGRILAGIQVLAADGDAGLLKQIGDYVGRSKERTASALDAVEQLEERLSAIVNLLKQVSSLGGELRQAGVFLRALGVNTSIESSRANRIGAMFSVVARDSVTLAETIAGLTDQLLDQADEARAAQQKTLARTLTNLKELKNFSRQADEEAAKAMAGINGLFAQMATAVEEAARISRNITRDIGAVVMGIQFHDNLRQRLEHINEALTDVLASLEKSAARKEAGEAPAEGACEAFMVAELQCHQLEALHQEIAEVFLTQTRSFATIAEAIGQLTRTLGGITAGSGGAAGSDVFAQLSQAVASLSTAQGSSEKLCSAISQSAEEAMTATTRLAGFVRETTQVASQVHLNALNSTIKAAKLGSIGRPLQVLSQNMASVAKQVKALAPQFMERMDEVQGLVRIEHARPEAEGAAARAFDVQAILNAFREFRTETAAIIAEGKRIGERVAGERRQLSFFKDLEVEIAGQAAALRDVAERARPPEGDLAQARACEVSTSITERYTMEQERAVHQQLLKADGDDPAMGQATPGGVELFSDDTPADGGVTLFGEEEQAAPSDAGVVLFDTEPAPSEPEHDVSGEEKKEKEFGENVDLF